MSALGKFLRLEQTEQTKQNPTVPTNIVEFPTDPSKVYLKQAPPGYKERIKNQPEPNSLESINAELASKAMAVKQLAEQLRKLKEQDLKALDEEYKQKVKDFKQQVGYDESIVELDRLVKEVGNSILSLMVQAGETSFGLYKLQNLFVLVDRELKEQSLPVTDADRFESLKQTIKSEFDEETANRIIEKAANATNSIQNTLISMNKKFSMFPISEEYRKKESQYSDNNLYAILNETNNIIIDLLVELHNLDTVVEEEILTLEHLGYGNSNNVLQLSQPVEKAAVLKI